MPGEMDALLPCPICLKAPKVRQFEKYAEIFCYHVEGDPDDNSGGLIVEARCDTLEQASAAWNRRSAVTAPVVKAEGDALITAWKTTEARRNLIQGFYDRQTGRHWIRDIHHGDRIIWQEFDGGDYDRTHDRMMDRIQQERLSIFLSALEPIPPSGALPRSTGCFDKDGNELFLGDRVLYRLEGSHTKKEYWNPEYEIVWEAPTFTLKHVGGGKPGDSYLFKLRHGGQNGNLELLSRATPSPTSLLEPNESARMTEDQIKHMVNRFLGWHLPQDFHPDGGISFERIGNRGTQHEYRHQPSGTNLLDATRAREMVLYMLDGMPTSSMAAPPLSGGEEAVAALKAHLRDHWLAAMICDPVNETDTAICSCSQWRDEPHPSVGEAADAWIEHVFSTLKLPAAPSPQGRADVIEECAKVAAKVEADYWSAAAAPGWNTIDDPPPTAASAAKAIRALLPHPVSVKP